MKKVIGVVLMAALITGIPRLSLAESQVDMPALRLPSLMEGIELSGYVDATYVYNFNGPDTQTNVGHVFDRHSNSFNLNIAELVLERAATEESRVGFRVDLMFGNDAEVIGSAGLGSTADEFDLEQAYVQVLVPTSEYLNGWNDIDMIFGKFVTWHGAEVIESKDNWNISRSFLFGYAIPFTHTGVMGTYTFDNEWDLALGVVNGWDNVDDNNSGKSVHGHFGLNSIQLPGDSELTISLNGMAGPEAMSNNHSYRYLGDIVATYKTPWEPLTLMYNFDYGYEEDLVAPGKEATWHGHAGYARFDINDKWAISGRGEFFDDEDGVRVVSGTAAEYWELTGTLEYRPWNYLITRLEFRYDDADASVFNDENAGTMTDSQSLILAEVILTF